MNGKYQGVIDLMAERKRRVKPEEPTRGPYMMDLKVYAPLEGERHSGWIETYAVDDGLSHGDRLRGFASALEDLALLLRDQAETLEPGPDGFVLSRVLTFENSRVRAWTSNKINSPEYATWMARRLDEAKDLVTEHALQVGAGE